MFSRQQRRARFLHGLTDVALTTIAFEAAYQTRLLLPLENTFFIIAPTKALVLGVALLAWVLAGLWLHVYERLDSRDPRVILSDSFRQCAYGVIAVVLFEYVMRLDLSRPFLSLFAVYSWCGLFLFRLTAGRLVSVAFRDFGGPHIVLVAGTGPRAERIGAELERSGSVRLKGFLDSDPGLVELKERYPVFPWSSLRALLRAHVIDEVVFAVDSGKLADLEEVFLLCDEEGVRTRVAVDFFPHVNSDVYLERFESTPLLTFSAAPHDEVRLVLKRIVDLLIATSALIALLPLMLAIAALIRLTSRGPAIYRQQRCGLNGRRFTFYKFRSMVENAEELKATLAERGQRGVAFKLAGDPRVTPIGRWLRKFSVDEWPQLWNVLIGDMSLVGPRPAVPEEVERYQTWQRRRLRMRPGLTCLWAISGRDSVDFETWMKMDMQYIDNWSLALDWKILLLTIPKVLTGKGAS